jgi:hypothetical protein
VVSRRVLVTLATAAITGFASVPAQADSLQIYTKPAQPVGGELFEVHAAGSTSFVMPAVAITVKQAPATCNPDPSQDTGGTGITPDGPNGPGQFDVYATDDLAHGQYVICAWIYDQGGSGTAVPAQATITVADQDSVSISTSPRSPVDGQPTQLNVTSLYDQTQGNIDAVIAGPPGSGCAPTPGSQRGARLPSVPTSSEAASSTLQTRVFARGSYRLCVWLLDAGGGVVATGSDLMTVRPAPGAGGLYSGRTYQHRAISFAVYAGQTTNFVTSANFRCTLNGRPRGTAVQPVDVPEGIYVTDAPRGGAFGNGGTEQISYRFTVAHGRAKGWLRDRYISVAGNLCDSGRLSFDMARR